MHDSPAPAPAIFSLSLPVSGLWSITGVLSSTMRQQRSQAVMETCLFTACNTGLLLYVLLGHWERLGWRGIKGRLLCEMIDLQEVFCSPACLSGAVFTSALQADGLAGIASYVCLPCTLFTFTSYPSRAGDTLNLYHDLPQEAERILKEIQRNLYFEWKKESVSERGRVKSVQKNMHNFHWGLITAAHNLLVWCVCVCACMWECVRVCLVSAEPPGGLAGARLIAASQLAHNVSQLGSERSEERDEERWNI